MGIPRDYDDNPDRYRRGMTASPGAPDLYALLAAELPAGAAVLDLGCAEGVLSHAVTARGDGPRLVVGLDRSATMLRAHPGPAVRGCVTALPFGDGSFDVVVAVNCLCHLGDPRPALREARRVLVQGGLFLAATIAHTDSPELAAVWRPGRTAFDAEQAPELVRTVFPDVEIRPWDEPMVHLPDTRAVRDYLVARLMPPTEAEISARWVEVPLTVTKRGALILAR
ncbi:class I SAM-dependent methyltransferase [Crossiella sp. CA198]|uniref:class I SAM-dependent methyltransferase n=1 Tax=Crossiella sp. CA198 TaxID=3455607 RepID=UPI003F8D0989